MPPLGWNVDQAVNLNRSNLRGFAEDFRNCVDLFTLLERGGNPSAGVFGGVFIQYRIMAARQAALSLYHFASTIKAIATLCGDSKRYNDQQLIEGVLDVCKRFSLHFPKMREFRHAIAHEGELHDSLPKIETARSRKKVQIEGIYSAPGGILKHALFEREYTVTRGGEVCTLSVSAETLTVVVSFMAEIEFLFQEHHARTVPP